jgi:hypothetical protein
MLLNKSINKESRKHYMMKKKREMMKKKKRMVKRIMSWKEII